jgi:hypothetical protein
MAYQVNKTDGTIVATVADGQIDTLSTSLTLIGKNYSGFGEALNENFVALLENFAATSAPLHPIRGQIWFDTNELKLKVYSGTEFIPVSSATIASTQPLSLGVGDLWFNDVDKQLFFYDGSNTILLGPSYTQSQGLSGLKTESLLDTLNQTRVITYLYNNGILLGIFAKDSFTPKNSIIGFTGDINPGFNAGNLADLKFNVTVSNADTLGTDVDYPTGVPASVYVRNDSANDIDGLLRITKDAGIIIGSANQLSLSVNSGDVNIANSAGERNMYFLVRRGGTQETAMSVAASTRTIGLYSAFADSRVNVGGDLVVTGNLTVSGSTTTINTSTLTIEDKNIELATGAASNSDANGGGITLKGGSGGDKTLTWTTASAAWNSSEHINLAAGKEFKIDGVPVLNATTIYAENFPNVNKLGPQIALDVGPGLTSPDAPEANVEMRLEDNRISTVKDNLDLELSPNGTGNVALIGSPLITGLQDPRPKSIYSGDSDLGPQDAATREYADKIVETQDIIFSMDLSDGKPNSYIINQILNRIAPPLSVTSVRIPAERSKYRNGTYARILCTLLSNASSSLDLGPLISTPTATFNTPTGTAPAVTSVAISTATIPGATITTTRQIKVFQIENNIWKWVSDTLLPPA